MKYSDQQSHFSKNLHLPIYHTLQYIFLSYFLTKTYLVGTGWGASIEYPQRVLLSRNKENKIALSTELQNPYAQC